MLNIAYGFLKKMSQNHKLLFNQNDVCFLFKDCHRSASFSTSDQKSKNNSEEI